MRHLVIGDLHGRTVDELEGIVDSEGIDSFICLGDFDQVRVIRSVMDLEDRFNSEGKQTVIVPGNHDCSIFYNEAINSGTLHKQGKNVNGLHRELKRDKLAHDYIKKLISGDSHGVKIELGERQAYVVHGGLAGDLSSYRYCPEKWKDLWFRLEWECNYKDNFDKMDEFGYDILIRGHDHFRNCAARDENGKLDRISVYDDKIHELNHENHIIMPGAWFDGDFLIIGDSLKKLTLDYRNMDS